VGALAPPEEGNKRMGVLSEALLEIPEGIREMALERLEQLGNPFLHD